MKKKIILLTGFRPFGNYPLNPTEQLAHDYHGRSVTGNEEVVGIVLPCTYRGAYKQLGHAINQYKPDAIISTGLASSVRGIRIETVFRNLMDGKYPDKTGFDPKGQPILTSKGVPYHVSGNADHLTLANVLYENQIPCEVSANADAFICNSLAYLTSYYIQKERSRVKNLFIHIPWPDDYADRVTLEKGKAFIPKDDLYNGVDLLIQHI